MRHFGLSLVSLSRLTTVVFDNKLMTDSESDCSDGWTDSRTLKFIEMFRSSANNNVLAIMYPVLLLTIFNSPQVVATSEIQQNKKAMLSQRWPRDARYISSRCGDMAIRNIQDGGGRHLEFVRIENSAIRSAVPENPTIEPNMKWIGSPVAEIWPFAYVGGIWNPRWGGEERS